MTGKLSQLWRRLLFYLRRDRFDRELEEEMRIHLEMKVEENLAAGTSPDEARYAAQRQFGNQTLLWEESRDMWGFRFLETLAQDLRYGLWMMLKNPGFTAVVVLTLALGIGANTAIFTVVNSVLLRPLPFQEPERLVRVWRLSADGHLTPYSFPDFADIRAQQTVFEGMGAWRSNDCTLTGQGDPVNLSGVWVTADLFPLLGVTPQLGRGFTPEEDRAGNRAVILSHSLWQNRFNSDPNVAGKPVTINSQSYKVAGVMPAGFKFPIQNDPVDLWLSLASDAEGSNPLIAQRGYFFSIIGRLKANVTAPQAEASLRVIMNNLARQHTVSSDFASARLIPFHEEVVRDVRLGLLLMLSAVGCVLLIACANVANLLLQRATTRRREIAIRAALGAGRGRILRQLLTESLLLALSGGAIGWLLALWGTKLLISLAPRGLPRAPESGLDLSVVGFTVLVSLATGVIFGLAPALQAAKTDLNEALKDGAKGGGGARSNRFRNALIVVEVALTLMLLVCSGLLFNSFLHLQRVDPGFDSHNVLTFRIDLPATLYSQQTQVAPFYQQLISRLEAVPGVKSVSAISHPPLSSTGVTGFSIEGVATAPDKPFPYISNFSSVTPGYFETMGIQLIKGRDFTPRDELRSTPVAILNETLARRYFPNQDPLGKRVMPAISRGGRVMREIVGVVSNSKHASLREEPPPSIYVPHGQFPSHGMTLVVRSANDPKALIGVVEKEAHALDSELPVFNIMTLDQYVASSVAKLKFSALLLGLFAGLALFLSCIGLYGVMSYVVAQRTRELGIRMALGAQTRDVLRMVVRQGMWLTLLGAAIGVAGAVALTRMIKSWLFGVSPTDPLTFAVAALLLTIVALLSCWVPARRAAKVDPITALRFE
jgi:putative ABC transport system permease protein